MWLFPALRKVDRLSDVKAGEDYRTANGMYAPDE
jgi:hypothetical protein